MLVLGSAYTLSFAVLMMDPIRIGWLRRQASRIYYGSLVSTMLSCFDRHSCQLLNLSQWILTYVMALSLRICCKLFRVSQATRLRPGSDQTRRSSENLCNATMYSENCHAEVYSWASPVALAGKKCWFHSTRFHTLGWSSMSFTFLLPILCLELNFNWIKCHFLTNVVSFLPYCILCDNIPDSHDRILLGWHAC